MSTTNNKMIIKEKIVSAIKSGELKMRPRRYFIFRTLIIVAGFTGLIIASIFLVSLMSFSLRSHGPMGEIRFSQLLSSFPWWALILAVLGLAGNIWILKKTDFSYKSNFFLLVLGLVLSVLLAGWLINYIGLDDLWLRRGSMREIYRLYQGEAISSPGPGWRKLK